MRCEYCRNELNPLSLKEAIEADKGLLFKIECMNPDCQKHNWVSKDFYLRLRQDFLKPYVPIQNNKLPSEMNVIFVSLERHGISSIIRALSQFHQAMFGIPITFEKGNAEISQVQATRNRFPLPLGWNNVYDVTPQKLLDKIDSEGNTYDRVVLVQRDLKSLLLASLIYWKAQGLNSEQIEALFNKLLSEYERMYGQEDPKDHRFMRISLDDLNNYSVVNYNKLMDFLNFPSFMRPPVLPIPTDRRWEAYSSQLRSDEKLCGMLKRIEDMFQDTIEDLEKGIQLEKVLVIGPGHHKRCHFSENMYFAYKEKGYQVELLDLVTLGWGKPEGEVYKKKEKMYPISKALEYISFTPDLILFDEPAFYFFNDVKIPVFYSHRDFLRNPTIHHPDIAFFWHQGVLRDFQHERGFPYWCARVGQLRTMNIATDNRLFTLSDKKEIHGVCCIAGRETMKACFDVEERKAMGYLGQSLQEIVEFCDLGLQWIEDPEGGMTDERFRELLSQCEALWICFPLGQYVSRRILEAMVSKVICIIKLENEEHEDVLRQMGFEPNIHYISIKEVKDMVELHKTWDYSKYKDMIEKAYEIVMNRHLFIHRVDEIAQLYKNFMLEKKVIIG